MQHENKIRATIATLKRELAAIHQTNALYWQKQTRNPEDKADFQTRITRMDEILDELDCLAEAK